MTLWRKTVVWERSDRTIICEHTTQSILADTSHSLSDPRTDLLVIDIDSKDPTATQLSFPPPPFLAPTFLAVCRACLRPEGLLLLNYGVHTPEMKAEVWRRVAKEFEHVYEIPIENGQNR